MEVTRDTQSASPTGLALGFIGGFIATLIFHELAFLVLNSVGLTNYALYSMAGVPPLDVPRIISLAFWGGVFGLFYPFLQTKFGRGLPFAPAMRGKNSQKYGVSAPSARKRPRPTFRPSR
jgi:hypothetical protein